jgi:hypothetical protein
MSPTPAKHDGTAAPDTATTDEVSTAGRADLPAPLTAAPAGAKGAEQVSVASAPKRRRAADPDRRDRERLKKVKARLRKVKAERKALKKERKALKAAIAERAHADGA